jgi:hypothetical protein
VQLATAMQPATAFQDELAHLVRAFESAKALQRRFVELSRAFGMLVRAMLVKAISLAETTRPDGERASSVNGL